MAVNTRAAELNNVAGNRFDLCVIGGGATGAACALDAQLRGIPTVLLEATDFAGGASSASTKIIHGGVRYLEEAIKKVDLREYHVLVRALQERIRMLENAPHLSRKLEFVVPSYRWSNIAYLGIGLKLYDWLAGSSRISPSKFLSQAETLERTPQLKRQGLIGSVAYADGQFDDARYNIALVQSFCAAGGNALNHAKVTGFQRDALGKVSGVVVEDALTGKTFAVASKALVNATGPVSDSLRRLATPSVRNRMRPSKGAHILLPLEIFPTKDALLIPKTEDGRVLFAIPWHGRLLVGTTDEAISPDAELLVSKHDVEYLLRHLNRYLERPVTPDSIVSGFAGARPLVSAESEPDTKSLSRDYEIEVDSASGLISILGGKWTTHRAMAEDTIHRVQQALGVPETSSKTRDYVLHGGEGYTADYWQGLCARFGVSEESAVHLASKFGTAAEDVAALAAENVTLAQPILEAYPAIQAEVVYSIRHEMAVTIEDVLARRVGLQFFSWRDAIKAAPVVGYLLAEELDWSADQTQTAIVEYKDKINRYLKTAGLVHS